MIMIMNGKQPIIELPLTPDRAADNYSLDGHKEIDFKKSGDSDIDGAKNRKKRKEDFIKRVGI